jgi:hypothetical protein
LLAEAVRLHEEARGTPLDERAADERARVAGGDFEHRLLLRAESLSVAPPLRAALDHLRAGISAAILIGIVMAFAAGCTSARVVLGSYTEGPINFFLALTGLLGLHALSLLLWLIIIVFKPASGTISLLGGLVVGLGRRLTVWLHKGPLELAAVRGAVSVLADAHLGRWLLSSISHCLWLAFIGGALAVCLLLLSTRQYDFAWETTILSESVYVRVARIIAAPVAALGFQTPDARQIATSRWTGQGGGLPEAREAWGGLLIGSLVVYGLLPRALVLLISVWAFARARARYRLDTGRIGFVRLQGRLLPLSRTTGIVDREEPRERPAAPRAGAVPLVIGPTGPVAILGLEIDRPDRGWPPPVPEIGWWDLGFVDNRSDRRRIFDEVAAMRNPPRALVVACSLAATPDRGTGAFLGELVRECRAPIILLLTQGQRLRARGHLEAVDDRIQDWRRLAGSADIPENHVIELDLDYLTDASRHRLSRLLGSGAISGIPGRHLEQAFALIVEHAAAWSGTPEPAQQAELQRAIAKLYGSGRQVWQELLRARLGSVRPQLHDLRASSRRMVDLLPARLRQNTRWLAAGAAAGALSCVAASTLLAPAAIATLPAWAGLGALLSAVLAPSGSAEPDRPAVTPDLTDAVNAAALFAVVLELQGRDETEITRIIDRLAGDADPPPLHGADDVRAWLDILRDRFDRALAAEGRT